MRQAREGQAVLLHLRPGALRRAGAGLLLALASAAPAGPLEDARAALGAGKLDVAATRASEVLAKAPLDPAGLEVLAEARTRQGRVLDAFHVRRRALAARPGDPGTVAAMRAMRKPLVRELRGVLRKTPGSAPARHALAFLLALEGKRQKALEQLRELTRLSPSHGPAWQDLGWLETAAGRAEPGARALGRAVQVAPQDPAVRKHFQLQKELAARGGPPAGKDPYYGLLEQEGAAPPDGAPEAPPPPPPPGTPRLDFEAVDLDDDSLVASLLRRVEQETGVGPDPEAPETPVDPATPEPPEDGGEPAVVPTPLEVLKKLEDAYARGEAALRKGRFEEAERAFAFVVSIQARYRDAQAQLEKAERGAEQVDKLERAKVMLDAGDGKEAARVLGVLDRRLLEKADDDLVFDALLGDAAYLSGQWAKAESYLSKALPRLPRDAERRYRLVMALAHQKKAAEALEALGVLEQVAPGYAGKQQGFGRVRLELYVRRYFLVIAGLALLWMLLAVGYVVFAGRRKVHGDFRSSAFDDLIEARRQEDWKKVLATAATLEGVELEPEDQARVLAARIAGLIGTGALEDAEGQLRKLRKDHPDDPGALALQGSLHLARGEASAESLPALEALMRADPANQPLLELMNDFAVGRSDYGELAHEVARRLNDLQPDTPAHIVRLARFRLHAGDTSEEAEVWYRRALSADGRCLDARKGLALVLQARGESLEALRFAKEVLHEDPADAGSREVFLAAVRALGLHDEGIRELERLGAGKDDPWFAEAARELTDLRDRAAQATAQERAEEKELGGAYQTGVKLFSEGRFSEAVPHLEGARAAESFRLHAGALLVRCYLELGEVDRARESFQGIDDGEVPADEFMIGLLYELAVALQGRGEDEAACDLLKRVCKADVEYRDAFERFEELQEQVNLAG